MREHHYLFRNALNPRFKHKPALLKSLFMANTNLLNTQIHRRRNEAQSVQRSTHLKIYFKEYIALNMLENMWSLMSLVCWTNTLFLVHFCAFLGKQFNKFDSVLLLFFGLKEFMTSLCSVCTSTILEWKILLLIKCFKNASIIFEANEAKARIRLINYSVYSERNCKRAIL